MIPQPDLRPIGERWYGLMEDYTATWKENGALFSLTVNTPFNSDGASVPRFLWTPTGITPDGPIRAGALLHDFIYRYKGMVPVGSHKVWAKGEWVASTRPISRERADWILKHFALAADIHPARANLIWLGVRGFGWWPWRNGAEAP